MTLINKCLQNALLFKGVLLFKIIEVERCSSMVKHQIQDRELHVTSWRVRHQRAPGDVSLGKTLYSLSISRGTSYSGKFMS